MPAKIPNEKLIEEYFRIKQELGRQPTPKEISRLCKYALRSYSYKWGSWSKFLYSIGETPLNMRGVTKEQLKENYRKIKRKLQRIPTLMELGKYGKYSTEQYSTQFGGYKKFLEEMGEETDKQRLMRHYKELRKKLGKTPTAKEFTQQTKSYWTYAKYHFGSWNNFVEFMGDTPRTKSEKRKNKRNISNNELLEDYYSVMENLGKIPTTFEIDKHSKYSSQLFYLRFGSLRKIPELILSQKNELPPAIGKIIEDNESHAASIVIEKHHPIPAYKKFAKYPFASMEVGDSIFVTNVKRQNLHITAQKYAKKNNKRFIVKNVEGGVRCWRVK